MKKLSEHYESVREKRLSEISAIKSNTEEIIVLFEGSFDDVLFDVKGKSYIFEHIIKRIKSEYADLFDYKVVRNYLIKRGIFPYEMKVIIASIALLIIGVALNYVANHLLTLSGLMTGFVAGITLVIWMIFTGVFYNEKPNLN